MRASLSRSLLTCNRIADKVTLVDVLSRLYIKILGGIFGAMVVEGRQFKCLLLLEKLDFKAENQGVWK